MAVLLALSVISCRREDPYTDAQLMVSLYIPSAVMTRAETGMVNPLSEELTISSLQIWVFLSEDGTLVSYKRFGENLDQTGMPNSMYTRFGLPLSKNMFNRLTSSSTRPKVDVYAVANVASAVSTIPSEATSRDDLDRLVINKIGGNAPLTMAVPATGLPMSGVLKGADVTGGYPVLNITTLKLTRAVSKIRFVFCQQGVPATDTAPAELANDACEIVGISFDGTTNGKDCRIGASERLFTEQAFDLGDQPQYVTLSAYINGTDGNALIPNNKLSVVVDPEEYFFRGLGNESETAEHYEARLDAAIASTSQVGPIYLRETDKQISGNILYRTAPGGPVQRAAFSLEAGEVFSRNHTWIVSACFQEETMKLQLKTVVLPWEWETYSLDYTTSSVNVIRRFTVFETPTPSFTKEATGDGFFDVKFWHTITLDGEPRTNYVYGDIIIATPVGGTLHVIPVPQKGASLTDAILVSPAEAPIYPNYANGQGKIEDCKITITISCNKDRYTDAQLEGNYIDLRFAVETPDHRFVDLGSESIDYYRFILTSDWDQ